ncbi:hypothetical protein GOP47_0027881 [Adiantum capillus-veneris]|nr:hypothetical protein GOP47_0027881 [Adiantum capillus-veneris]
MAESHTSMPSTTSDHELVEEKMRETAKGSSEYMQADRCACQQGDGGPLWSLLLIGQHGWLEWGDVALLDERPTQKCMPRHILLSRSPCAHYKRETCQRDLSNTIRLSSDFK